MKKKMENRANKSNELLKGAAELSVLYFPVLFMGDLIETIYPFKDNAFIFPLLIGILCFFTLISDNAKDALKKWGLSIPFSILFWLILTNTHFIVRLTNMIYPGYGRLSAGGGFAIMIRLILLSISHGVSGLLAVALSNINGEKISKLRFAIQNFLIPAICAAILLSILFLEFTMPSLEEIYSSLSGYI